jgi:NAD(P)-dependent dehydrogenase (short-subunit alcohol dehydrogenase family)
MALTTDPLARFRLDGRVAVVTGGAQGIGRALAEGLAGVGATVVIADLPDTPMDEAVDGIEASGGRAEARALDVRAADDVDAAFAGIAADYGRLDVLVNNAGIAIREPTTELSLENWQAVVDVNMTGVFLCAQAAAKPMLAQGDGRIINIASIMGLSGGGLYPNISYQATKGAVVNMTRALAVEWAKGGVRVNALAPTWVSAGLAVGLLENPALLAEIERITPMGRLADVDDLVGGAIYLASDASAMVTGHTLAVDGGFLAQ